jgi:hypothetical protein
MRTPDPVRLGGRRLRTLAEMAGTALFPVLVAAVVMIPETSPELTAAAVTTAVFLDTAALAVASRLHEEETEQRCLPRTDVCIGG